MNRLSDRGSTPLGSTTHSHVKGYITKTLQKQGLPCQVVSLFVLASIDIEVYFKYFFRISLISWGGMILATITIDYV